jgi:predicted dehydrogenase
MTVMAAAAGKDIFCQKPLSLTVQDGREMVEAVRKENRILQTGSQWRSSALATSATWFVTAGLDQPRMGGASCRGV